MNFSKILSGFMIVAASILNSNLEARAESAIPGAAGWTNNAEIVHNWTTQNMVRASSVGNGTVNAPNDYVDQGSNVSLSASANIDSVFEYWTGLPEGVSTTNSSVNFSVNEPITNIVAYFRDKTNVWENVGFSSISIHSLNKVNLEIPSPTCLDSIYSVYGSTNIQDSYSWLEKTNKPGNLTNLLFEIDRDKEREFYKAKRNYKQ